MSVSLQLRVFQQRVPLASRVLFCLMSANLQFRQGMKLINRELFCLMSANLFLIITRLRGSPPPPPLFANPAQPVFRLPTAPSSGGFQQETTENPQNPVARDHGVQTLQQALASIHQTIASLTASGRTPPQSLLDSASSLTTELQDARLSPPQPGVSTSAKPRSPQRVPTRPETTRRVPETTRRVQETTSRVPEATTGVHETTNRVQEATSRVPETAGRVHETTSRVPEPTSRVHETTTRGSKTNRWTPETTQGTPDHPKSTPMGPGRLDLGPAVPGQSRGRSFESPQRSSDHSSRRGSHTPPRKRRRHSDNSSDEEPASQNRQQRDDQQDEEDSFRYSSLDLLLNYITSTFPAASQPLIQPSSKRFHVMESAGLVDESSQQGI